MKYLKTIPFLLLCLFVSPSFADNSTKDTPGKHLDIIQDGKVVARWMYAHDLSTKDSRHDTYKPYLHVMGPDGKTPITKGPGGKFTHHRGIFLGWNRIGFEGKKYDLWHMKTSEIIHKEIVSAESSAQPPLCSQLNSLVKKCENVAEKLKEIEKNRRVVF